MYSVVEFVICGFFMYKDMNMYCIGVTMLSLHFTDTLTLNIDICMPGYIVFYIPHPELSASL